MRVALATVGTTGDVRPFAILGRQLVERGHEVLAVSWPVQMRQRARCYFCFFGAFGAFGGMVRT